MTLFQNGVEVFCPIGYCEADEGKREINEVEKCPCGYEICDGDCHHYSEE